MKIFITALILLAGVTACEQGVNYKTERDGVMKFHDVVMEDQGKLTVNQLKLETLLKSLPALKKQVYTMDTLKEKVTMLETLRKLNKAERLMNQWMQDFEPDISGKSNDEAVKYFREERVKIGVIDSVYRVEIASSTAYLSRFKR